MTNWQPASPTLWQGRDDRTESPNVLRLFQIITLNPMLSPKIYREQIALLGFACDEGVKRNQGRTGAVRAPDVLRKALTNLVSHDGHSQLVDLGDIVAQAPDLEGAQQALRNATQRCQYENIRTFILDGGHEAALAHGTGILDVFPQAKVGIVSFDAHLDLRHAGQATFGTPFRQLAQLCDEQQCEFHYVRTGVSRAANTQALWDEAQWLGVTMVEDLHCDTAQAQLAQFIANLDATYMTVDLDALPVWETPGVSAPAVLGVPLATPLRLIRPLCCSDKLLVVDMVEPNPCYDDDGRAVRVVARLGQQVAHWWH